MPVPQEVLDLVARFEENLAAYASNVYNETQLRREFVDPLLGALGWDLDNVAGHAEAYKDVIHEDATDRRIDHLVYDLYDLTKDKIRLLENDPSSLDFS